MLLPRPWNNGEYGRQAAAGIRDLIKILHPEHPLYTKEIDNLCFDFRLQPGSLTNAELFNNYFIPCLVKLGVKEVVKAMSLVVKSECVAL